MVKIRLRRQGGKKHPFYRMVVAEARSRRNGRCIAEIGYYNPTSTPVTLVVAEEEALRWLREGAQPSETARALLRKSGVLARWRQEQAGALPVEAER